jgi:YD repeat-containing protein
MVLRGTLHFSLLAILLIAASIVAHAQKNPGGAKDSDIPVLTISTAKDPVDKSYRRMVLGMDLFEKSHHLAPDAALRFKLLPRRRETDMSQVGVEIAADTFAIPVRVADDNTFTLERIQKALDEDASVRSNRKSLTMTWRTDIRTPGLPPDIRRLGDLRLECAVGMEADLVSNRLGALQRIADLFGATRNYCNRAKPRYFFFAERPVFNVILAAGARREPILIDMFYAGAADRPMTRADFAACDCEVLLDRAFYLPLGDRSWPDDTRVEFEYMDDGRLTEITSPAANAVATRARQSISLGKSTKSDVLAGVGKPKAVRFETGFEVWAYRFIDQAKARKLGKADPVPETELVVLFDPSGTATKVRVGPDVVFSD